MVRHWSVTVRRNGEDVVRLEQNCLMGRDISPEDEWAIRAAALHLLAFIGEQCELLSRPIPDQLPLGREFSEVLAAGIADGELEEIGCTRKDILLLARQFDTDVGRTEAAIAVSAKFGFFGTPRKTS